MKVGKFLGFPWLSRYFLVHTAGFCLCVFCWFILKLRFKMHQQTFYDKTLLSLTHECRKQPFKKINPTTHKRPAWSKSENCGTTIRRIGFAAVGRIKGIPIHFLEGSCSGYCLIPSIFADPTRRTGATSIPLHKKGVDYMPHEWICIISVFGRYS